MSGDRLRALLAGGGPAIGCFSSIESPYVAETLARAGFDWILVDLQHGGATWATVGPVIQAVELGGAAALVRVGGPDPAAVMRAVDLGAAGVIVPTIDTAEQARAVAAAIRFPPRGNRSYGPVRGWPGSTEAADAAVLCLPMIETAEGLRQVDAIAATDGVDGLFLGPVDLALSLGLPHDTGLRHPALDAAVGSICAAAQRHGRLAAGVALLEADARSLIDRGMRMLAVGSDRVFIAQSARAAVTPWRSFSV